MRLPSRSRLIATNGGTMFAYSALSRRAPASARRPVGPGNRRFGDGPRRHFIVFLDAWGQPANANGRSRVDRSNSCVGKPVTTKLAPMVAHGRETVRPRRLGHRRRAVPPRGQASHQSEDRVAVRRNLLHSAGSSGRDRAIAPALQPRPVLQRTRLSTAGAGDDCGSFDGGNKDWRDSESGLNRH